jgi:hypothetical protein
MRRRSIGKWGFGEPGTSGQPHRQGFDEFFGYSSTRRHAHNHFPSFLWRNVPRSVSLPNDLVQVGRGGRLRLLDQPRRSMPDDLITAAKPCEFIERTKDKPFFLYLSLVTPHANNERSRALGEGNEVPDQGAYAVEPWNDAARNHAADDHAYGS